MTTSQRDIRLKPSRSGFSLIEALVVLAISGMALAVIFTIGTKAGDAGFGLGRRAMAASDADIATGDLRSIIRSVSLRPHATFEPELDQPAVGEAERFEAEVVMEKANQCGPLGWSGRVILTIESDANRSQLVCESAGRKTILIDLGPGPSSFSYSRDGRSWGPRYTSAPANREEASELRSEAVWIRVASAGSGDVVEMASSGPPAAWLRLNRDF